MERKVFAAVDTNGNGLMYHEEKFTIISACGTHQLDKTNITYDETETKMYEDTNFVATEINKNGRETLDEFLKVYQARFDSGHLSICLFDLYSKC